MIERFLQVTRSGIEELHHLRGTSEIQRLIIGCAVTGLQVR
ncbi:hypothetical protein [Nonomuraea dietziae]